MKVPRGKRDRNLGFNMTPMIDITFLLVIFFLVAYHWSQQDIDIALALPTAASGKETLDDESPRVTVNVTADGEIYLAGEAISTDELADRLRAENTKQSQQLEVRIRADRNVFYEQVEPVLKSCAEAGIGNVKFAVKNERQS